MRILRDILVICLFYQISTSIFVGANDLYSDEDDVLRLKHDTFKSTVFGGDKNVTFVVQFYNTFCGHCQMFSPIYKELATRVRNWTSVVRIAGIDCSKDDNAQTCKESEIGGFPTIYIYPPNSRDSKKDTPLDLRSLNIEWTFDDIEETIITYIGNLTSRKEHPLVSDAMQPITVTSLAQFRRIYSPNPGFDIVNDFKAKQDLLFIVESEKSFLGRRLMIEYFRIHSKVELRRVLLSNKVLLKRILSNVEHSKLENNQPLLIEVNDQEPGLSAQVLVRGEASHILPSLEDADREDFISNRFRMFLEQFYHEELKEVGGFLPDKKPVTNQKPTTTDVDVQRRPSSELDIYYLVHHDSVSSKRIFAVDLLKGITYMITHEIRIKGDLTPAEFNTIRNLLTILKKFLPLDRWDATMSRFISDLRTKLDDSRMAFEKNGVHAQEMRDLLEWTGADTLRLRYSRENWVTCHDSDRQYKGYTCSLWLLFHTLTMGEYMRTPPVRKRNILVLTTMRDYIIKFLGCTVCSSNFERETENLEKSITARDSSVIWLWRTHNRVNQRLNNEKQQDKRKPLIDVLYPHPSRCPTCYKSPLIDIGVDGRNLDDIEWQMPDVVDLISETYHPDNVITPVEMATMLKSVRGKINYEQIEAELNGDHHGAIVRPDMNRSIEQWNLQSIFSASDMSICLSLYFCCIVIVALVCFSLNPKFRRPNGKSK